MIGHDPGKPGSWYEEEYVVLQLLRLLNGELRSVTWEVEHEDGEGIDCRLSDASGKPIAVQCKTRSTGQWTPRELQRKGVLETIHLRLAADPSLRFHFVTDAGCPALARLLEKARTQDRAKEWWEALDEGTREVLSAAWHLEREGRPAEVAHALALRIELCVTSARAIEEGVRSLAIALSSEPGRLRDTLRDLARRSLTRELGELEVRNRLGDAGIALIPRPADPRIHDQLDALASGYLERVDAARGPLPLISRAETQRVVDAVTGREPRLVLVHGPAGCGKSEVIAGAVRALREHDPAVAVLALTPDIGDDEIGLERDPIGAFFLYAAGRRAVLVIDQYDQVLLAGEKTQQLLRRCHRWIRSAKELGLSIVIGARTAEAKLDTQLEALLGDEMVKVPVNDLDEAKTEEILKHEGIALSGLEAPLRALLRRPLALRLAIDLHRRGGTLTGLRTLTSVVDRWWDAVAASLPGIEPAAATEALDGLLHGMERDGVMSVRRDGVRNRPAVEALVRAGALTVEAHGGVEHLRPIHQILADVRIALGWADVESAEGLIRRLGAKKSQSLHQARRLRLVVPLLLERPNGIEIVGDTVASDEVRPVLKQAVFVALAAVEQPVGELVELVERWLDDPHLLPKVLPTVVRGQREWVRALAESGWLDRSWETAAAAGEREKLQELLDLLASVSEQWGDGVATLLRRWKRSFPETLDLAGRIFLQAPGADTDALFEMRVEHLARTTEKDPYFDWETLLRRAPRRAIRLLEVLLSHGDPNVLTGNGPVWCARFPAGEALPPEGAALGMEIWRRLSNWWCRLELREELLFVRGGPRGLEDGFLPKLVELLAAGLAHELGERPQQLDELLREMPTPLREVDGWLLLATGARLPAHATKAADLLLRWFMSEPRWAQIRVGHTGSSSPVRRFVEAVGTAASEETFRELEDWLLAYRDPWTEEEELQRIDRQRQLNTPIPSRVGETAHLLLPLLPAERLSLRARRRLGELRRKFGEGMRVDIDAGASWVRSEVPDEVAVSWTASEWLKRLRDPNLRRYPRAVMSSTQLGKEVVTEYSLSMLASQLASLASRKPRRFLPLALRLEPADPWEIREKLLFVISPRRRPRELPADAPWEPLDDEEVASIVVRPAYLEEPEADRLLAWVVSDRPAYRWPESIRQRLAVAAKQGVRAGISRDHGLTNYRLNETGCAALDAIAALAVRHEDLRSWALGIASDVAASPDPGRRASAGAIAAACGPETSREAVELLLTVAADPVGAAEREVTSALYRLALGDRDGEKPFKRQAIEFLLAMAHHDNESVANSGGEAAVWLRWKDVIGDEEIQQVRACGTSARRGMANVVQQLLVEENRPGWLCELAIVLAGDADRQTSQTVVFTFLHPESSTLLHDRDLIDRLISGAVGAGHDIGPIVEACDREALLRPVSGVVLSTAGALSGTPDGQGWRAAHHLTGLLARLVEEAEREGDFGLRNQALDAWDELLEAGVAFARTALAARLEDR
ncbi:MAG TPA: hypothetical protein ENK19_02180 [Acidobacteria bacterium]|nr:hypothetical protein [Acidobacteriota bacterium]